MTGPFDRPQEPCSMTSETNAPLTLPERLERATRAAFVGLGLSPDLGQIAVAGKGVVADFQCNGVMAAARALKRNPRELAQEILPRLKSAIDFAGIEVAGPGFLNFTIDDAALRARLETIGQDQRSGHRRTDQPGKIIIDYGGPNAAKAMHVGHLRSAVIGQCLKNVLRFQGHDVTGDIHLGDWGLQMGQLITEIARNQPDLPYFDPDKKRPFPKESPCTMEDLLTLYPQASARSKDDPAAREAARIA